MKNKHFVINALFGIFISVVIWYLLCRFSGNLIAKFAPDKTLIALLSLVNSAELWLSIYQSLVRFFIGVLIAAAIGIPVGILTGYFYYLGAISYFPFQFLRNISPLSWTPIAIIILGIGSGPVYFLIAMSAIWPIILNTAVGVRSIDQSWIEIAKCLGADDKGIIKHVILRGTLPYILSGLQLAVGVAWIVLVPAEMLGVSSGLGYMILDFRDINDYSSIMAVIIVIGIIGVLIDLPMRKLAEKLI